MESSFSFEGDEEWDLDLIQNLVRKEEEAIAAKKITQTQLQPQQQPQLLTIPSSYGGEIFSTYCTNPNNNNNDNNNTNVHSPGLDLYMYSFSPPRGFTDSSKSKASTAQPGLQNNNSTQLGFQDKTSAQLGIQNTNSAHLGFQNNSCVHSGFQGNNSARLGFQDNNSTQVGFQNNSCSQSGFQNNDSAQLVFQNNSFSQVGLQIKRPRDENYRRTEDVGISSQPNKNVRSLEREVDRLSEQLIFQDQEKLELCRDRDEKEEKLRRALESLAAKEAEIEHLKKPNLVGRGLKLEHENERITTDNIWSSPWAAKEISKKANTIATKGLARAPRNICSESENCIIEAPNASADHNDTSFVAEELRAHVSIDNASNRGCDCNAGQAEEHFCRDTTTAQPKSGRTRGTSSGSDQDAMISSVSYKLRTIWDPAENGRWDTNIVSKLFVLCGMDLYALLWSTQGSNHQNKKVSKDMVYNDLSEGGHVVNGAKDIEAEKITALSLKLRFILAKLANAVAPVESLIEALLEFCTLRNVEIVESAFRILNSTLRHGCSFRREKESSGNFQGCSYEGISGHLNFHHAQRSNERLQSQDLNKLASDCNFNVDDCKFTQKFSSRVLFCKRSLGKRDWKPAINTGLDKNLPLVNEENCEKQMFRRTREGCNPLIVNWVTLLKKICQIALDSASTGVKLQAVSTMNAIVMKSHPDSEREKFGPILFYRSLSELLRKEVGIDVQLQAVQLLFLLLNCPRLLKLFCGCKEDTQMQIENNGINLDVSFIEGTYEMVLQGLAECISQTGYDMQVYTLRRRALHVLAFIAASGNMGIACLLSSMHSGCSKTQEPKTCIDSGRSDSLNMEGNTGSHNSDSVKNKNVHTEQSSNDVERQTPNILMLLVALLDSEIDEEEKDVAKVDSSAEGISKERATLIREALILLHSLACNPTYEASVLQVLTNGKVALRLSLSVVMRITNRSFINSRNRRVQKFGTDQSDTVELAKELQQRILSHARDVW